MTEGTHSEPELRLRDLQMCFEGLVPAVVATADADGQPNVTYLSRVQIVDEERVALSNQFFSKTARNIAENPRAEVLLIDENTYDQFRLALRYERTERHGRVFEALRRDVDAIAALEGMQDVFKLRAADVYRVVQIERVLAAVHRRGEADVGALPEAPKGTSGASATEIAELSGRLGRCGDLDTLVSAALTGLAEVLGFEYSLLMLLDEAHDRLYTIGSHGYAAEGVGSEVELGAGVVGMAAQQCQPVRVGRLLQARKYSRSVRLSFEAGGQVAPGVEIPTPGLERAGSQLAVPAMALGRLVGVLMVESERPAAFDDADEAVLNVVASMIASAIEVDIARERSEADDGSSPMPSKDPRGAAQPTTQVRFFEVDGSVFLGTEYLIKGVAGRILWSLVNAYVREDREEFTNREIRLDPTVDLPEFRDNLESRLILLKRRLDEREAPIRIVKTGRGRLRLEVQARLQLDVAPAR
ncbi:MAG: GAF domain-containing protein [Acidimicrobiia bacterium]|nr:GAF domain-containing protein [Acidimicrobiia bacterium]